MAVVLWQQYEYYYYYHSDNQSEYGMTCAKCKGRGQITISNTNQLGKTQKFKMWKFKTPEN